MKRITHVADLRAELAELRNSGKIAFVPTMGNLHAGHISLMEQASGLAEHVVASIFINPTQFNNPDDLAAYPVTIEEDCTLLEAAGVTLVFLPTVAEMYPLGLQQGVRVEVPGLSDVLCGEFRPGHFTGVATVVTRLFNMVQPDIAVFGEKDFQQLLVIRRMVRDLAMPIEIVGGKTMRESNGLAMSSRNGYLTQAERDQAGVLYQTLLEFKNQWLSGERECLKLEQQAKTALQQAGFRPEYCTIRRCDDLAAPETGDQQWVILAAAYLGSARLIDNVLVP